MRLNLRTIDADNLYTVEEVAGLLRLSQYTTQKLVREKKITGAKIGRSWLVQGKDLLKFLEDKKNKPPRTRGYVYGRS